MKIDLKSFLTESIKAAELNEQGRIESEKFLEDFANALQEILSKHLRYAVKVSFSDTIEDALQRLIASKNRFVALQKNIPSVQAPVVREIKRRVLRIGKDGGNMRELVSYEPDPVRYFPVSVSYGTKEISCDNASEVQSAIRVAIGDSMAQILEFLSQEVKK